MTHRMQHNEIHQAGHAQAAHLCASEAQKSKELEDLKAQMVAELESQHVPSVLTMEEHRASNQTTKILQACTNQLQSEGVTLHCGRKSKTAPTTVSQPSHPATLPLLPPELPLDPKLDPTHFPAIFSTHIPNNSHATLFPDNLGPIPFPESFDPLTPSFRDWCTPFSGGMDSGMH